MIKKRIKKFPLIKSAFTLLELLIVIAVIILLVSILLPALSKAKRRAGDIVCQNNLKQAYTAFLSYAGDFNDWVPVEDALIITIPQYIGNLSHDYGNSFNRFTCRSLQCPNYKNYVAVEGKPYCFSYGENDYVIGLLGVNNGKFTKIPNPSIKFLMADGTNASGGKASAIYSSTPERFGFDLHKNGVNILFCDGHAEWRHRNNINYASTDYFWNRYN